MNKGRPKTKYMLIMNGNATGKILYAEEITQIFGIDKRNLSKYINGRLYLERWCFEPVYEEEKKTHAFSMTQWDNVTGSVLKQMETMFYVSVKHISEMANFEEKPTIYKTISTSKNAAMKKAEEVLGSNFVAIDATTKASEVGLSRASKATIIS